LYINELLSSILRDTCRALNAADDERTFAFATTANAQQRRALDLVGQIQP
jgi:hypothetical protein